MSAMIGTVIHQLHEYLPDGSTVVAARVAVFENAFQVGSRRRVMMGGYGSPEIGLEPLPIPAAIYRIQIVMLKLENVETGLGERPDA